MFFSNKFYYFVLRFITLYYMNKFEYIVTKIINIPYTCDKCKGSGQIKKPFRKTVFVHDCPQCKGEGRLFHRITEEVPLLEALKESNII